MIPYACEHITVADTAVGFTEALAKQEGVWAEKAMITAEVAQMRFTLHNANPTSSYGHIMNPGDALVIDNLTEGRFFKAIRTGTTSGVLVVTYYKR